MTKQIAVIDDSPPFRLLVQQLLQLKKYSVSIYEDADQFFKNKRMIDQFDLIMVDMHMPGMNGLTALENLKSLPATKPIPVLIITGEPVKETVNQAIRFGVSDFMSKPIDPQVFISRVEKLLGETP